MWGREGRRKGKEEKEENGLGTKGQFKEKSKESIFRGKNLPEDGDRRNKARGDRWRWRGGLHAREEREKDMPNGGECQFRPPLKRKGLISKLGR